MIIQDTLIIQTHGRGTIDITNDVSDALKIHNIEQGLCNLFCHHTSASLIICENADPTVRHDLERFVARLVPDGDSMFQHHAEGDDDMPAHIRTILTQTSLQIPIVGGKLALGTWQGIYLWEHRTASYRRKLTLTLMGE